MGSPSSSNTLRAASFFHRVFESQRVVRCICRNDSLQYSSPNAPDKRSVLGTLMLSILAGHKRYAHISAIRCDGVNPELLGMQKIISEDAARRALIHIEEEDGIQWLEAQLARCTMPVLSAVSGPSWILDTDTTVKCLYGKQEGAVVGYNYKKTWAPFT